MTLSYRRHRSKGSIRDSDLTTEDGSISNVLLGTTKNFGLFAANFNTAATKTDVVSTMVPFATLTLFQRQWLGLWASTNFNRSAVSHVRITSNVQLKHDMQQVACPKPELILLLTPDAMLI
jgi:anti-sigma-K factor RskA